jgi:hypothetical protein
MLRRVCSWIAAIAAFILLTPILAYAVSGHSDFGVTLAGILKQFNLHNNDDQPEGYGL